PTTGRTVRFLRHVGAFAKPRQTLISLLQICGGDTFFLFLGQGFRQEFQREVAWASAFTRECITHPAGQMR
ncbi:MAG: hypothetical protein ACE5NW_13290, partial [Acidiferrobacterales bacterium]